MRCADLISQLNTFVGGLDAQKGKITTAIDRMDSLLATLDDQKQIIAATLDTLPGALKVLADERKQLVTLLQSLDRLSTVAVSVIGQSKANTVSALTSLDPILTQLTAAGQNLPKALELVATYPFPRNAPDAVRGDYTNLDVTLDLNLSDILDNLKIAPGAAPANAGSAATSPGSSATLPAGSVVPGTGSGG